MVPQNAFNFILVPSNGDGNTFFKQHNNHPLLPSQTPHPPPANSSKSPLPPHTISHVMSGSKRAVKKTLAEADGVDIDADDLEIEQWRNQWSRCS